MCFNSRYLDAAPAPELEQDLQVRYYTNLAETYRQLGNLLETANALQAVDAIQTDPGARLQTQTGILRSLALLNERVLMQLQPSPPGVDIGRARNDQGRHQPT